jgi:hypothetical protein
MAPLSKTIMQLDYEAAQRAKDPIGYAIKEHERTHHRGFFSFFASSNTRNVSSTCPPPPPNTRRK